MDDLEWATRVAEILTKPNEELAELEEQRGQTVQQKITEETEQGEKEMSEQQYQAEVMDELKQHQERYKYLIGQGFIDWIYKNRPISNGDQLINAMEDGDLQLEYLNDVGLPEETELEI